MLDFCAAQQSKAVAFLFIYFIVFWFHIALLKILWRLTTVLSFIKKYNKSSIVIPNGKTTSAAMVLAGLPVAHAGCNLYYSQCKFKSIAFSDVWIWIIIEKMAINICEYLVCINALWRKDSSEIKSWRKNAYYFHH